MSDFDGADLDEQAIAERTDDDVVGTADFPPERPVGADSWGTTSTEEEGGESVRRRAAQEDPRRDLREPLPAHAGLLEPDEVAGVDVTGESIAVEGDDPDRLTAEEEAVHLVDEPDARPVPGLTAEAIRDDRG